MKFVLCSEQTYQELYAHKAYKWIKIQEHNDLLGFKNVHVTIHDCWMYEINDDRVDYLEPQLEALADFGYIKITYKDSSGWCENYEPEVISKPVKLQLELPETVIKGVVAYETVVNNCESGACAI